MADLPLRSPRDHFAAALARFQTVADAAASLGKTAAWGHKEYREICNDLGVPCTRAEDLTGGIALPHK